MKIKITELIIIGLIIFMIGGILSSVKGPSNNDITNVISEMEKEDIYDTSGYISGPVYDEDNENAIGKVNESIGNAVSKGINKLIDGFFELVKKLVS